MEDVLRLLEKDARFTPQQLAAMTGKKADDIEEAIKKCESDNVIIGYTALVDWDKVDPNAVTALIEVKIAPQRGAGFDRIAERIYQFEEVESLYLMSGAFDLAVIISGRSIREISEFVFGRLAPIDGVTSTATHIILKKYKDKHRVFANQEEQQERLLFT